MLSSKDMAREILRRVDDKRLLKICSASKKMWNEICNDDFLKKRLSKYPKIEKYKEMDESWKRFFLRSTYYISKMREEFEFTYMCGDFAKQYSLIKNHKEDDLIIKAIETGELSLIEYSIKNGAFIRGHFNAALQTAGKLGRIEVVNYLIEKLRIKLDMEN